MSMDSLRSLGFLLCVVHLVWCQGFHDHIGPSDCAEVLKQGHNESKVYRLWPLNWPQVGSFRAYCDMETDGGGWTVFQRRGDYNSPSEFFRKSYTDYKRGFGRLDKDFWLGNDRIFSLTNQGRYTLRVEYKDDDGLRHHITYREFWIESEQYRYKIHLSGFGGHDHHNHSLSYANDQEFNTYDTMNDDMKECAKYKGGWWFASCTDSDLFYLNGPYENEGEKRKDVRYYPDAEMKVRPQKFP